MLATDMGRCKTDVPAGRPVLLADLSRKPFAAHLPAVEGDPMIGFVAIGYTGDLKVPNRAERQVLADFRGHVAFDDLAVVQVHLHLEVGSAYVGNDFVGVVLAV